VREIFKRLIERGARRRVHEQNFGVELLEWPDRAEQAIAMLGRHAGLGDGTVAADWGCGKQIVRRLIPPQWTYVPYDRIIRSADTRVIDFNRETPDESADVVFCLGLLEYVDDLWEVLGAAIRSSRWCLFSYVKPRDEAHRVLNGWKWNLETAEFSAFIEAQGASLIERYDSEVTGQIFLVRGPSA
jgi:hypothetical protein